MGFKLGTVYSSVHVEFGLTLTPRLSSVLFRRGIRKIKKRVLGAPGWRQDSLGATEGAELVAGTQSPLNSPVALPSGARSVLRAG